MNNKYQKLYKPSNLAYCLSEGMSEKEILTYLQGIGYRNPQLYLEECGVSFPHEVK